MTDTPLKGLSKTSLSKEEEGSPTGYRLDFGKVFSRASILLNLLATYQILDFDSMLLFFV
jgi:hypothetical protein